MKKDYLKCPPPHDGEIPIYFDKILIPYNRQSADLLTPSVPSPKSYKHLQLVQKNLAWSGVDIIRCWNKEDGSDAVIYLGKWGLSEATLEN